MDAILPAFQSRLRSFAFGPELDSQAEELLRRLGVYKHRRARIDDRTQLKALALVSEYLDAMGRAGEAAALLRLTVGELMDGCGGWEVELQTSADRAATRRLLRQRVWCAMAYALTQLRTHRLAAAGEVIERMREFVEAHLASPDFPCHGTLALIRYYRGLWRRNQGQLNEAACDFDVAIEEIQTRLADKQAKYEGIDPERLRREAIYARVSSARVFGFGHGGIALSRGRYVEARGWLLAAQQILAQLGQETWRRSLEVYARSATVLVQDLRPASQETLGANGRRLAELSEWFRERNPRNGFIAEAFSIVAEVRLRQIGGSAGDLDLGGLQRRLDACLRTAHADAGPMTATACLRLIECLLRAGKVSRCEAELDRFQRVFGGGEEAGAEFAVLRAELWIRTARVERARTLLSSLIEQRPPNRAYRARAWALLSHCEQAAGEAVWAVQAAAMAKESLEHVQDGYAKAWVAAEIERMRTGPAPPGDMPYQNPDEDARWCDLDYNLEMARLRVVEAVYQRHRGHSVEKLAAVMGRGHSWLYAFLARHGDVGWVRELLGQKSSVSGGTIG